MHPPGKISLCSIRNHLKLARSPLHPTEDAYSPHPFAREYGTSISVDERSPRLIARDYIAMLATCRSIHDEARPILYENTEFRIHCSGKAEFRCFSLHARLTHDRDPNGPWRLWRDCEPEVDVFQQLKHARSISFQVFLDPRATVRDDPWMQQMPIELSGALNLRKLHISFWSGMNAVYSAQFQALIDHTMSLFGKIECKCLVTAAMEDSVGWLGLKGLKTASYYAMLDALKG